VNISSHRFLGRTIACFAIVFLLGAVSTASCQERLAVQPQGTGGRGDQMGMAVALHGDTLAVGAPYAVTSFRSTTGAVTVYRLAGDSWISEATLAPAPAVNGLHFGSALALAEDLLVVEARQDVLDLVTVYTFTRAGSVWQQVDAFEATQSATGLSLSGGSLIFAGGAVYVRSGNGWALQQQLSVDAGEFIGAASIDGDICALSAARIDSPFSTHSYAYFYSRTAGNWTREAKVDLGASSLVGGPLGTVAVAGQTALASANSVVHAFVRDDGNWVAQGTLDPLTSVNSFGSVLAIQEDRAVVGSPSDDILGYIGAGSAYVFDRTGGVWSRSAHLADPEVGDFYYAFATSLAVSGDTLVAGVPGANTAAGASGRIDIFSLQGGSWIPLTMLDLGDAHRDEEFGRAVAVSDTTLLVGAWRALSIDPFVDGAAYVFERIGAAWTETACLMPSLAAPSQLFGQAVALNGDVAAVGAPYDDVSGAVYLFARGDGTWPQQTRLGDDGEDALYLGWSLAFVGANLAVGEPGQITGGPEATWPGHVRVFAPDGGDWSEQADIVASDGAAADEFGFSLAASGSDLFVGAPRADIGIDQDAGAVYVYSTDGTVWTQEAKLTALEPIAGTLFGVSVALAGDTAVVGAGLEDSSISVRGAAYVFGRVDGAWSLQATLTLPDSVAVPGSFGRSVALSADQQTALVGAPAGDGSLAGAGVVYVFARSGSTWQWAGTRRGEGPTSDAYTDGFGTGLALDGSNAVIGAPGDGAGGAVYLAPVGDALFADGFEMRN